MCVRQLAVVEDLVLQVAELLDDLLALGDLLGVVHLGDGAVNIVNGLGLIRASAVSRSPSSGNEAYQDDRPSVLDRVVGEGRGVRGHGLGWKRSVKVQWLLEVVPTGLGVVLHLEICCDSSCWDVYLVWRIPKFPGEPHLLEGQDEGQIAISSLPRALHIYAFIPTTSHAKRIICSQPRPAPLRRHCDGSKYWASVAQARLTARIV